MTDGYWLEDGKSRDVSVMVEFDYALTDRFSVSVGLPYVFAKYVGPGPTLAELLGSARPSTPADAGIARGRISAPPPATPSSMAVSR